MLKPHTVKIPYTVSKDEPNNELLERLISDKKEGDEAKEGNEANEAKEGNEGDEDEEPEEEPEYDEQDATEDVCDNVIKYLKEQNPKPLTDEDIFCAIVTFMASEQRGFLFDNITKYMNVYKLIAGIETPKRQFEEYEKQRRRVEQDATEELEEEKEKGVYTGRVPELNLSRIPAEEKEEDKPPLNRRNNESQDGFSNIILPCIICVFVAIVSYSYITLS